METDRSVQQQQQQQDGGGAHLFRVHSQATSESPLLMPATTNNDDVYANSNSRAGAQPSRTGTGTGTGQGQVITGRRRMTLGIWLRLNGPDLILMALSGALGLGIYMADPAPTRSFPVFNLDGSIVHTQFAYPLRREIVPIWLCAFLSVTIPMFFFMIFQIRRRSLLDFADTTMGLLKSLLTAAVFQVFLKWLIGGLRPHFLEVCKPQLPASQRAQSGNGFQSIMYDRSICTGDRRAINDSLESFPSGHTTAAFAGFVYLSLYFNAQLKVMAAHNPQFWKTLMFFAPLLGATLIGGALTIDEFHNWYDIVAGAIIGTCTALVSFRQTFAAIWDFRFNHLRLPRTSSLFLPAPDSNGVFSRKTHASTPAADFFAYYPYPGSKGPNEVYPGPDGGTTMLPFTREGGWGRGAAEATLGAPGDATVLYAGATNLFFGSGAGTSTTTRSGTNAAAQATTTGGLGLGLPPPVTAARV